MTTDLDELRKPLTPIEKGELAAACASVLKPAGMALLRRLMFESDSQAAALAQWLRRHDTALSRASELKLSDLRDELANEHACVVFWQEKANRAEAALAERTKERNDLLATAQNIVSEKNIKLTAVEAERDALFHHLCNWIPAKAAIEIREQARLAQEKTK